MSLLHQQSLTLLLVLIQVLFVPAVFTAPVYLNDAAACDIPKSSSTTGGWFTVSSLPTATRANAAIMTRILDMTAMGRRADSTSASSDAGSTTSTTSLESSNTNTAVPTGAIVGGAAGGTVVLVVFVSVIFLTRRRNAARIDPFPLEVPAERDQARGHGAEMSQHSLSIPSSNPKVRPTTDKRSLTASKPPLLLPTGTESQISYDPSPTASFHYATISDVKRTLSHAADASSVVSSDLDWHRRRPLPPLPVPDAGVAYARPHGDTLAVVTQSLVHDQSPCSPPLVTPVSALDVDVADCTESFAPARRDSEVEPACSIRRLPTPPPRTPGTVAGLSFDGDGRPDSPSMARMYAELLELQRQVARIREDLPGDAPPDYAESVVGRTRHAAAP